jgi:hypothetical protein
MQQKILAGAVVSSLFMVGLPLAPAQALTFTASSINPNSSLPISAAADFSTSGSNLVIQLTNTSAADALVPTDILTGLFFNLPGNPTLTPVSALVAPGSTVVGFTSSPTNVGGEWAYNGSIAGGNPAQQGTSSSGLTIFGNGNFNGTNLQGPNSVDGVQFGITSAGDNPLTGNGGLSGNGLIKNSVVLTLSGLPAGFNPSGISNVSFQYGTDLAEPRIPGSSTPVPTPALLPGLIGLGVAALRKSKVGQAAQS